LYLGLTAGHMGTTFPLKNYGYILHEGLTRFIELIEKKLEGTSCTPSVEYETFLNDNPVKTTIPDPSQSIKEAIEAVIKEERKKLLKGMGKDRLKEDDLLNMSHLGMSLLTLSDNQNTSREMFDPETPRMLDDNLLNFENQYKDDKQQRFRQFNNYDIDGDFMDFSKSKKPRQDIPSHNKRVFSGDKQYTTSSKTRPMSRQETIHRADSEKPAESEYSSPSRPYKAYNTVKTEVGNFSNQDNKGTFGDFFGGKMKTGLQGPMSIQNMVNATSASQYSREDSNSVRKAAELLRKTAEGVGSKVRGGSVHSQNNSVDNRSIKNDNSQTDKFKMLKTQQFKPTGSIEQQKAEITQLNKSELKSLINAKKTPGPKTDTPTRATRTPGKSPTPQNEPEPFLTAHAKVILQSKMTHKSIPTRFHPELFKLMDCKSKSYDFSDSQMGDLGVYFLSKYIRQSPEIDQLKLDNCKISDDGLSILLWSMADIRVDKLYLRDNQITKDGLDRILEYASRKKSLTLVNLKSNPIDKAVTASYIKEFSAHRVILLT
jgi:hypothetical protein